MFWIICRATRLAATAVLRQADENAKGFDHAVAASGRDGPLAGKGGMGRILRIEIVVLAASPAIVLVRRRDLQNRQSPACCMKRSRPAP